MNQNKSLLFLIFTLLFVGCTEKSDNVLEIYLLEERQPSSIGIPMSELSSSYKEKLALTVEDLKYTNFDTINNKLIFGGEFNFLDSKIQKYPFLKDDEIIAIDTVNSIITLNKSGVDKITNLKPDMINGVQFVICNNKKPVFSGYFWSKYSSFKSSWYCIEYDHLDKISNTYKIYKSFGMNGNENKKIKFTEHEILLKSVKHKLTN